MPNEAAPKKRKAAGAPAWMTTFADLMSLLLCFFVLLLSFSEIDIQKYRQLAGSLASAFGVQRDIAVRGMPMGTSFIAQEFSPGRTDPTPINTVQQMTSPVHPHLDTGRRIQAIVNHLRTTLDAEIRKGFIEIETQEQKIIIRIQEKGSFPSGSAELMEVFKPTVAKIGKALQDIPGLIVVAGHTDNIPIASERFRSNWELSSSRAVTVVHELFRSSAIPMERFRIEGYGEVTPLTPNDTPENRALNRRVEITLEQDAEPAIKPQTTADPPSIQQTEIPSG